MSCKLCFPNDTFPFQIIFAITTASKLISSLSFFYLFLIMCFNYFVQTRRIWIANSQIVSIEIFLVDISNLGVFFNYFLLIFEIRKNIINEASINSKPWEKVLNYTQLSLGSCKSTKNFFLKVAYVKMRLSLNYDCKLKRILTINNFLLQCFGTSLESHGYKRTPTRKFWDVLVLPPCVTNLPWY